MSEHPNPSDLELLALAEATPETRAHVEACVECTNYVAHLVEGARAFARERPVAPFIDEVARAAAARDRTVVPLHRLLRTRIAFAVAPLAAAALVLFLLRPSSQALRDGAVATLDQPNAANSRETTFKGGMALAVVRERSGVQDRVVGEVEVRPFDRIRLELALDNARPIAAGVLADDGSWASLFSPVVLDGGTHFSELSVRFDENPRDGWILVGEPLAVDRARRELAPTPLGPSNASPDLRVIRVRATK